MYNSNVKGWGGISGWQSVPQLLPSVKHVHRFCVFPYHWEWSSVIGIFKSLNIKNSFSFKFIRGCAVSSSIRRKLIDQQFHKYCSSNQIRGCEPSTSKGGKTLITAMKGNAPREMCKHRKKVPCANIARKYHV